MSSSKRILSSFISSRLTAIAIGVFFVLLIACSSDPDGLEKSSTSQSLDSTIQSSSDSDNVLPTTPSNLTAVVVSTVVTIISSPTSTALSGVTLPVTATQVAQPTVKPVVVPLPTSTAVLVPTPTEVAPPELTPTNVATAATETVTPVPSLTPSVTPAPLPTETPTAVPSPTEVPPPAIPTVIPTATSTVPPTATPFVPSTGSVDSRYGVVHTTSSDTSHVTTLGVSTYLDYSAGPDTSGSPAKKVIYIRSVDQFSLASIQSMAINAPGSTWYVLGEPNVKSLDPSNIVVALHDIYTTIRNADSTAKITSPSVLNFDFTCILCGGYQSGHSWADEFVTTYSDLYGSPPPVDYWAIDIYPIIWDSNMFPTVRSDIVIDQVSQMRQWLNAMPTEASKPIIITEVGLHWGYSDYTYDNPSCSLIYPAGEYQSEAVTNYLGEVFTELESMAVSSNIHSWFLFSTYRDLTACIADGGYGLTLFETPASNSPLSPVGQFYYNWIRGARN